MTIEKLWIRQGPVHVCQACEAFDFDLNSEQPDYFSNDVVELFPRPCLEQIEALYRD